MSLFLQFPAKGARIRRLELYREGGIAIILEAPAATLEAADTFGQISGRPSVVFLRRMARRIADSQGFEAPEPTQFLRR
jgi:hypothetical protein